MQAMELGWLARTWAAVQDTPHPTVPRAIVGGLAGTTVMTLMMYFVAPMLLGQSMDVAGMLGSLLGGSWLAGMAMHVLNGAIIFPLLYAYGLFGWLPGTPWQRGTIWGLALWLLAQLIVTPMMGGGFFSARAGGLLAVVASLIAHAVYGALLGGLAGDAGRPARR